MAKILNVLAVVYLADLPSAGHSFLNLFLIIKIKKFSDINLASF